ncbi:unnamed protein product [Clonostachys byssicola]|uniref:Protein kinase domain-containing protein n=1 Tax=Clonostachys byssicola TaxID=160290 RepID=A0A9N9USA7_9HYPO|nr:unnamed protein product [Clonostachys byssicola]
MTWDGHLAKLGRGATSQIHQAQTGVQTGFAFKRVLDSDKQEKPEEFIYRQLINEISILRHPSVRIHPNIVELQGVCWDIELCHREGDHVHVDGQSQAVDYRVWPALVLEMSELGNLLDFAISPAGRELNIYKRLEICIEIGCAIADMHSYGIIHGDIKPHNVLVFKSDTGFRPKVADFGYSVPHLDSARSGLRLPKSRPWDAPEISSHPDFTLAEALKVDLFSYGMLCLWLLFEPQLSGVVSYPPSLAYLETTVLNYSEYQSIGALSEVKTRCELSGFSKALLSIEQMLGTEHRDMLAEFFMCSLEQNPQLRATDVYHALQHLPGKQWLAERLHILYGEDYRVREHIFAELEKLYTKYPNPITRSHLYLCQKLGFGCEQVTAICDRQAADTSPEAELDSEVETQLDCFVRDPLNFGNGNRGHAYRQAADQGLQEYTGPVQRYRLHGVLSTAECVLRRELTSIKKILGVDNRPYLTVLCQLYTVLDSQRRWKEALELKLQAVEALSKKYGPEHAATLMVRSDVCSSYRNLGRWRDAETLQLHLVEYLTDTFGSEHIDTLSSLQRLALIELRLGLWDKAEARQEIVVEAYKTKLGRAHGNTLNAMEVLVGIHIEQNQWDRALSIQSKVTELSAEVFGPEHSSTLYAKSEIATIYARRGDLMMAEEILSPVVAAYKRGLGNKHLATLTQVSKLATIYRRLGRYDEARQFHLEAIETARLTLGEEDPITLDVMEAWIRTRLGMEEIEIDSTATMIEELLEKRRSLLGNQHHSTISLMHLLALAYLIQSRFTEALSKQSEAVKRNSEIFGPQHPNTLASTMAEVVTLRLLGRLRDSESLNEKTLTAMKSTMGECHRATLAAMYNLAITHNYRGRLSDATELMFSCTRLCSETLGPDHPDTILTQEYQSIMCETEYEVIELLTTHGSNMEVTTAVLIAAAESISTGVLAWALQKRVSEMRRSNRGEPLIAPEVIEAVARNQFGDSIMMELLDDHLDEFDITPSVLEALVQNNDAGSAIIEMLHRTRPHMVVITSDLIEKAARDSDTTMLRFLLQNRDPRVSITSKTWINAAGNEERNGEVLSTLLEASHNAIVISTELLAKAAMNEEHGETILRLLLHGKGREEVDWSRVFQSAAMNKYFASEVLEVLLEARSHRLEVTSDILVAAASNQLCGAELMKQLLEAPGDHQVDIPEDVVIAAATNETSGEDVINILIENHRSHISIAHTIATIDVDSKDIKGDCRALLLEIQGKYPKKR